MSDNGTRKTPTPIGSVLGYRDACEHGAAELSTNAANNGIGMWCPDCRTWVTLRLGYDRLWLGKDHEALRGIDIARLPRVGAQVYRKCQGPCGQLTHCELHHLAPRAFLRDECEQWPTAWFCRTCHARWHRYVTPGLCTPYDPHAHARSLHEYLGLEKANGLTRSLIALLKPLLVGAAR